MIHNKKSISLKYLVINWISARSAPQRLSLKNGYTLHFSNFPITGLCNSSAILGLTQFYFQWHHQKPCYQRVYEKFRQVLVDIHHILNF